MTKFLIIRLSSIGDIVLTTPIMRCIHTQSQEKCHVTYLTKPQYKSLLEKNPHVDEIISWENNNTIKLLKEQHFDFVIDLHNNIRTFKIKNALRVNHASFPKKNIQKWLYVNFKWDVMPDIHIVDRYFETIKKLGFKNDKKGLEYHFNNSNPPNLEQWNIHPNNYVCFAIGGQFSTKRMPVEKCIALIQKLEHNIVLIGGKEDEENGKLIAKASKNVISLCGQLSLDESAHVIKASKVLMTHDTGMMHIGAAMFKPIVSIWGNTTPQLGMYPYMPNNQDRYSIHEVDLKCRPCSKIGFQKCPKKHFNCMNMQDLDAIIQSVNEKMD